MGEIFVDKHKGSKNKKTDFLPDQIGKSKENIIKQRKQVRKVYILKKTARRRNN